MASTSSFLHLINLQSMLATKKVQLASYSALTNSSMLSEVTIALGVFMVEEGIFYSELLHMLKWHGCSVYSYYTATI